MQQFEYYVYHLMTFHPSAIPTDAKSKKLKLYFTSSTFMAANYYNAKIFLHVHVLG